MTKEEAIRKVEGCLTDYFPMEDYGEVEEIIKALRQESCEDAISRKEAKKLAWDLELETCYDNERVVEMLDDLPSVAHTQKLGRWMFVENTHEHARCSECDYGNVDLFDGKPHNYCPNCGSLMMQDEEVLDYADQDTMMSAT